MTDETPFRVITFVLLTVSFFISGYFRSKAHRKGGKLNPQGSRFLIALRLLGLLILLPLLGYLINPEWVRWARLTLPDWLRWLGVICAAAMVPLFYWILKSIGLNISPSHKTREEHQLVTHGPYRWVRHPLYSAGLIFFLSLSLVTALWWLGIGFIVVFAFLMVRVPLEEANLIEEFGDQYKEYMNRTGRFLPKLRSEKIPDESVQE